MVKVYTTGKFEINSLIHFVRAQLRLTTGKKMLSRHILSNLSILIRYNRWEICVLMFHVVLKRLLTRSIFPVSHPSPADNIILSQY